MTSVPTKSTVVDALMHYRDPRAATAYDPPTFDNLAGLPALQGLCRSGWPRYHRRWDTVGGQKLLFSARLSDQIKRAGIDDLVKAATKAAGKASPASFSFQVDFLAWPENYHVAVSAQHIALGSAYLEPSQVDALRDVLQSYIARLV